MREDREEGRSRSNCKYVNSTVTGIGLMSPQHSRSSTVERMNCSCPTKLGFMKKIKVGRLRVIALAVARLHDNCRSTTKNTGVHARLCVFQHGCSLAVTDQDQDWYVAGAFSGYRRRLVHQLNRRAMRRDRIFRDWTNPLDIYDENNLFKCFRCEWF